MEKNRKLIIALSSILLIGGLGLFLYKKGIFSKNSVDSKAVDTKVENMSEEEYINYVMDLARKYGKHYGNMPSGSQVMRNEKKYVNEKDKAILNDLINNARNNDMNSAQKEIVRRLEVEKIALD
jgi:hypothetical protein